MTDSFRPAGLFMTPLEVGLRSVFLLAGVHPVGCDLQRLVILDYFLVHSGDVNGPSSLHAAVPHRSGEILVKRDVMRAGINLMLSRGVITADVSTEGVRYGASEVTFAFLRHFASPYAAQLQEVSKWLAERFGRVPDAELSEIVSSHLGSWGGEFIAEAAVRNVSA